MCLLYSLVRPSARRTPARLFETWHPRWVVLLLLLGMAFFLTMGAPIAWEISPYVSYVTFLFLFFTTLVVLHSLSRLRWMLLVVIGLVAFASLHVLREWQKYRPIHVEVRPGWVTGDPNYFTVSALLCLPLAL